MNVEAKDVLEMEIDGKRRVSIPAEKRREYGIEDDDTVEIAVLGTH